MYQIAVRELMDGCKTLLVTDSAVCDQQWGFRLAARLAIVVAFIDDHLKSSLRVFNVSSRRITHNPHPVSIASPAALIMP